MVKEAGHMGPTRRDFMRQCCCAAAMGVAANFSQFGLMNALAQSASDFRALVCIFLFGGNDSNNLLVPLDQMTSTHNYTNYLNIRKAVSAGGLALDQASLLP